MLGCLGTAVMVGVCLVGGRRAPCRPVALTLTLSRRAGEGMDFGGRGYIAATSNIGFWTARPPSGTPCVALRSIEGRGVHNLTYDEFTVRSFSRSPLPGPCWIPAFAGMKVVMHNTRRAKVCSSPVGRVRGLG